MAYKLGSARLLIDLNELAYFAVVSEQGSITKAAKALAMPKSTLSRRIARLEQRLDVKLMHRNTRRLTLTEAGQLYLSHCRRMLEQAQDAEQLIEDLQAEPSGLLRINTPLAFGTRFFQDLVEAFIRQYPKVRIELLMDDRPTDIIASNIDLAFHVGPLMDSELIARDLGPASWVLCATKEYLREHGTPRRPEDLYEHAIIRHPNVPLTLTMDSSGETKNINVQSRLLINDKVMVSHMTLRHLGIGLVHTMLIEEELRSGELIQVLENFPCLEQQVSLLYSSRSQLPSKTTAFIDFVLDRVRPIPPWQKVLVSP